MVEHVQVESPNMSKKSNVSLSTAACTQQHIYCPALEAAEMQAQRFLPCYESSWSIVCMCEQLAYTVADSIVHLNKGAAARLVGAFLGQEAHRDLATCTISRAPEHCYPSGRSAS